MDIIFFIVLGSIAVLLGLYALLCVLGVASFVLLIPVSAFMLVTYPFRYFAWLQKKKPKKQKPYVFGIDVISNLAS